MSFITTNHPNEGDTDDDDENYDCIQYNEENHDYALQKNYGGNDDYGNSDADDIYD